MNEITGSAVADGKVAQAQGVGDGEPKPFLGEKPEGGEGVGDGEPKASPGEKPEGGEGNPAPATEADYLTAVVKDEKLLGSEKALQLDGDLVKAMIPTAQELGVSPENMGRLANALAKAQVEKAREQMKDRVAYFEKMKQESMQRYSQKDFETINTGIDKWFKPGGVMNAVIRNSELGADPEFLALMHHLGESARRDGIAGAGAGGGGSSVDPNSTEGLSRIW